MSPAKGKKDDSACIATLNDGKASIKQKPLALDKLSDTLQQIVRFRDMCDKAADPVEQIPDDHLPLIAKLAHESTMLLGGLSRNIRKLLLPDTGADANVATPATERHPLSAFEKAVTAVAQRVNYGIDDGAAALCEWRWEAKDLSMFPQDLRDKLEARRADRVKAKARLRELFDALPAAKRDEYMKGSKSRKEKPKEPKDAKLNAQDLNQDSDVSPDKARAEKETTPAHQDRAEGEENQLAPASGKKVKVEADPAKEQKKAAKDKAKEDTKKSAALLASFFKKAPAKETPVKAGPSISAPASTTPAKKSETISDFTATFHPFTVKKDATLAPVNRFLTAEYKRACESSTGVIELNSDGAVVIELKDEDEHSAPVDPADVIRRFVSSVPARYRTAPRHDRVAVRDVVKRLNDAEVEGDEDAATQLLSKLKDRKRFPVKLLQFHQDVRPPYWGTWTKASASVRPRKPFGQDTAVLDYAYDSEEDWEDEPEEGGGGEEVDADAMSVDSDDESDTDSWLAADDEIEAATGFSGSPPPLDDDPFLVPIKSAPASSQSSSSASKPFLTKKRKAATSARDDGQKKRKVVPLVPWIKGPHWEDASGKSSTQAFKAHRIRLLNDAPYPIDPFTWVPSGEVTAAPRPKTEAAATFAVPELPSKSPVTATTAPAKKTQLEPTTVFPDEHVQYLLKAAAAHDGPLHVLCENVYKDLRPYKVYKNCIEKKIRAVCEYKGRKWIVKPEAWASAGLVPPQAT